ncbi:MAG: GNAT family protein [bacterium]
MSVDKEQVPAPPSLTGDKVYLRAMTLADLELMYLWSVRTDPQFQTCRPRVLRTVAETVESYKTRVVSESQQRFAICLKQDGTPVGTASFFNLNTLNRSAELGLLIDPEQHRQGYGSDGLRGLIKFLFHYRNLHKVHAQTSAPNLPTIGLLEKLGFTRDAVLRDHYFWEGAYHPGYVYSLLKSELSW